MSFSVFRSKVAGRSRTRRSGDPPYVPPDELMEALRVDEVPFEAQVVGRESDGSVDVAELQLLTEIYQGEPVYLHAWLCRPLEAEGLVPPLLVIPGGRGHIPESDFPAWLARRCGVATLAVDWIGSGRSSSLPDLDPWVNAMRFDGDDYRSSYQFHNVRGFVRAMDYLCSQHFVDPERLMGWGSSWGSFYTWLLAGIEPRFTHLFLTYGCGFLDTECRQVWESYFASMPPKKAEEWLRAFDPGRRAHLINAKVFFQQATNDKFYSLLATMKTWHRVPTEKHLLLVRNQDHFTDPYLAQDIAVIESALRGTVDDDLPHLDGVRWVPGTNLVEVDARDPDSLRLSVVYSGGTYTKSFGRYWRTAPVELRDGRYVAEIPVVDVEREIWLYGHAERGDPPLASSTPVERFVPADLGLVEPTAEFSPEFDVTSEPFDNAPIGDRQHPAMRFVDDDGRSALAMRFDGDEARRGVVFWLEGDLLQKLGYNGIEVEVKVPAAEDLAGLKLCVVSDLHALSEQLYAIDLASFGVDLTQWQTISVPFAELTPHKHRHYHFFQPPLRPMDVGRLCALGLFHEDRDYRGEALLGRMRVVQLPDAPAVPKPKDEAEPLPWPPRAATLPTAGSG